MGLWEDIKSGHASAKEARGNRFVKLGWIFAYIYIFISAVTIIGFAKRSSVLITYPELKYLSAGYLLLFGLFVTGYVIRKSIWMLPILIFQVVILGRTLLHSQKITDLAELLQYKEDMSPYFIGWIFGVVAYFYIRQCYEGSEIKTTN